MSLYIYKKARLVHPHHAPTVVLVVNQATNNREASQLQEKYEYENNENTRSHNCKARTVSQKRSLSMPRLSRPYSKIYLC